jgi:hypothetical protein
MLDNWTRVWRVKLCALIATLGAAGCSLLCGNQVVDTVPSPDGKLKAVTFWRDCGATAWSGNVSVVDIRDDLANRGGNVLVIGGNWAAASGPGDRGSVLRIEVSWESSTALLVKYDPRAEVFSKAGSRRGISVVYRAMTP